MERPEAASRRMTVDGLAKKPSRWGWSSSAKAPNMRTSNSSLAPPTILITTKEREQLEAAGLESRSALEDVTLHNASQCPKETYSNAIGAEDPQVQPQHDPEEVMASTPKLNCAGKSSALQGKSAQEEPEVRINIIVDPDSGETIGTVTLLESSSTRLNCVDTIQGSNCGQKDSAVTPAAIDEDSAIFEQQRASGRDSELTSGEEDGAFSGAQHATTQTDRDITVDTPKTASSTISTALPTDLYVDMTPREAAAEQRRLEKWINWAIITNRDPTIWRQKRNIARKRAARRRVLKRRAFVYSQRVRNALFLREGHHATHASFELLK